MLISAFQKDGALADDIKNTRDTEGGHIWWFGQSGFLLLWQGRTVLFDPYLSDSLTVKYANTDKPHLRLSEQAIDPSVLTGIDIVTSSHNHTDHLDAETLLPIFKNNPTAQFIIPEANRAFVCNRLQCAVDFPIGLNDTLFFEGHGFKITGVPAAHNRIERVAISPEARRSKHPSVHRTGGREEGYLTYMGFVVEFGNYAIYHSGDTLWYEGMVEILKPFNLDIALLPINGNKPERRVAGNLDCREAAELGKKIGAKWVIPHHYDMFAFNTANVADFVREAERLGQGYEVLRIGERLSF
jgi:L-ascorbate metabolism protein UlaG (beta-lactamase superfamily)